MSKIDANRAAEEGAANDARKHLEKYLARQPKITKGQKDLQSHMGPIQEALANMAHFVPDILNHIGKTAAIHNPVTMLGDMTSFSTSWLGQAPIYKPGDDITTKYTKSDTGVHFVNWLFATCFGIKISEADKGDVQAIDTLNKLVGFVLELQFGTAALAWLLKLFFCDRFPESFIETLRGIPEEIGLNWMLGNIFESVFESAVGVPLEEMINRSVHPARIDINLVKRMLQQHVLEEGDAKKYLNDLGYRKEDITRIMGLDEHSLGMGEIQTYVLNHPDDAGWVDDYLKSMGYDEKDRGILKDNYITHAETQSNAAYRGAARSAYRNYIIHEDQFRSILQAINVPQDGIDNEVKAIQLEQKTAQREVSVGTLRELWINHPEMHSAIINQLNDMHYEADAINDLTMSWSDTATKKHKSLPPGRIAMYVASGVLTRQDAHDRLVDLGYSDNDAWLIANHPRVSTVHHVMPYDRTTILSAYKDGIIQAGEAQSRLKAMDIPATEINELMSVAYYEKQRAKHRSEKKKHLSEGQINDALKYGFEDWGWAIDRYTDLGYNDNDAIMLAAISWAKANTKLTDTGFEENPRSPLSNIPIPRFPPTYSGPIQGPPSTPEPGPPRELPPDNPTESK